MAFNFSPKTANEITSKNKKFSQDAALFFNFVQSKYGVGITLDPTTQFKQVKVSRELEKKGKPMKDLIAEAKKAGINVSNLDIKYGSGSADVKSSVGSAIQTAKQETASKIYFEHYIEKGKYPPLPLVAKAYPEVDDSWIKTFELQSIALKEFLGNNKQYNYSRGDGFMKYVEDIAKAFGVRAIDTWNPADVYMVKKDKESILKKEIAVISENYSSSKNIAPLNDFMKSMLLSKDLLPISLKKLDDRQRKANLEVANVDSGTKKQKHSFGIAGNSMFINFDQAADKDFATREFAFKITIDKTASVPCQIRGFPGTGPREKTQVELTKLSGGARLGKVPAALIDQFFQSNGLQRKGGADLPKVGAWTTKDIKIYVDLYEKLDGFSFMGTKINWGTMTKSSAIFENTLRTYTILEQSSDRIANNFSNKLQGMHMAHNMMLLEKAGKLEEFLSILFYGAKKELGSAGPFIKIY